MKGSLKLWGTEVYFHSMNGFIENADAIFYFQWRLTEAVFDLTNPNPDSDSDFSDSVNPSIQCVRIRIRIRVQIGIRIRESSEPSFDMDSLAKPEVTSVSQMQTTNNDITSDNNNESRPFELPANPNPYSL